MSLIAFTGGAEAPLRVPLHCAPSPEPMTEAGAPTFLYRSALPFSRVPTVMLAFAEAVPRFCAETVQWDVPVFTAMLSGEQVFDSVTLPCFFTNATGIVTALPPLAGTRLIRPRYWP